MDNEDVSLEQKCAMIPQDVEFGSVSLLVVWPLRVKAEPVAKAKVIGKAFELAPECKLHRYFSKAGASRYTEELYYPLFAEVKTPAEAAAKLDNRKWSKGVVMVELDPEWFEAEDTAEISRLLYSAWKNAVQEWCFHCIFIVPPECAGKLLGSLLADRTFDCIGIMGAKEIQVYQHNHSLTEFLAPQHIESFLQESLEKKAAKPMPGMLESPEEDPEDDLFSFMEED